MSDRSEADCVSNDLVERVAREMWMADPDPYDPAYRIPFEEADWEAQRNYRAEARAAIASALNAWPGMRVDDTYRWLSDVAIILPMEDKNAES